MLKNHPFVNALFRRRSFYLPGLLFLLVLMVGCSAESEVLDLPDYSVGYDPDRDPFADGRAAIELASSSNRRILIEVGGDWCGWCRAMQSLTNSHADIQQQLRDGFVVLKVNFSDDNENEGFISGFPPLQGYPKLYISEKDGNVLHVQDPSEFAENGNYSPKRYREFLERWKNT